MTIRRSSAVLLAACIAAGPAAAATPDELDMLAGAIGLPRLIAIMSEEGLQQSAELRDDMFPDRAAGWDALASSIYDAEGMLEAFRLAFDAELAQTDIGDLLAFFHSDLGREIVDLEVSAREALLDPAVEEAAIEAFRSGGDADKAEAIEGFVEVNDLVELNVVGAMNASYHFYSGLVEGGGFEMTEDGILAEVWQQEEQLREDTAEWIFAYLTMAYGPLEAAEVRTYTALSETPQGRALNRALFAAFDEMFNDISRALGQSASRYALGEDI